MRFIKFFYLILNVRILKDYLVLYKDTVSEKMKVAINTLLEYFICVENSLNTNVTNGHLEVINNFIKSIKKSSFWLCAPQMLDIYDNISKKHKGCFSMSKNNK